MGGMRWGTREGMHEPHLPQDGWRGGAGEAQHDNTMKADTIIMIADSRHWTVDSKQQIADTRQQTADSG